MFYGFSLIMSHSNYALNSKILFSAELMNRNFLKMTDDQKLIFKVSKKKI